MNLNVSIKFAEGVDPEFPIPSYQSTGAAGLDLRAHLPKEERIDGCKLLPGGRTLISSGFKVEIPDGFEGQVRARSGLAHKYGIALANGVGTIDSDFRGVVGILLINLGLESFIIQHGSRIAQLVIMPVTRVECKLVNELASTRRDERGFGSTGES